MGPSSYYWNRRLSLAQQEDTTDGNDQSPAKSTLAIAPCAVSRSRKWSQMESLQLAHRRDYEAEKGKSDWERRQHLHVFWDEFQAFSAWDLVRLTECWGIELLVA